MKKIKVLLLLMASVPLLSFIPADFDGDPIPFEVIATGAAYNINYGCEGFLTIDNRHDYDDFWIKEYGDLTQQPFFNMNESRLIILPGTCRIDEVTLSSKNITVYISVPLPLPAVRARIPEPTYNNDPTAYTIVKIPYSYLPVKILQKESEDVQQITYAHY